MRSEFKPVLLLAAAAVLAAAVQSCTKEDREKTVNSQEESISDYISGTLKDYRTVRRNGSNRVIVDEGYGTDTLAFGDSLSFYYAGYIFNSSPSSLFATNVQSVAEKYQFTVTPLEDTYDVRTILYDEGCCVRGLTDGLNGMKNDEHSLILFSARYGFYDSAVGNIPEMSALCWEIWVESIKKNN